MSARFVMIRCYLAALSVALVWLGMWIGLPSRAVEEDAPKKFALLVGVNRSEMRVFANHPLQFAERDVQELAAVLKDHGFTVRTLTGQEATKSNINNALRTVLNGRTAKDVVVLGLAGHGVQMPLEDDRGKPVRDEHGRELSDAYFCPVNAVFGRGSTMISLTRLIERLDREGGINLLLVDSCRDNPDLYRGATRSLSGDELIGRLPANSAILFSCSTGQQALEHTKAGGGHGVFFYHIIEGLRGAAADPQTGEVGWNDLVAYVCKRVNSTARELDPDGARLANERSGGLLQTPHQLTNLVAMPVLSRHPVKGARPGQDRDDDERKKPLGESPTKDAPVKTPKPQHVGPLPAEGDFTGTWKWTRQGQPMGFLTLKLNGQVDCKDLPPGVSAPNSYFDEGRNGLFKLVVADERGNLFDRLLTRGRVEWNGPSNFTLTIIQAESQSHVGKTDEFKRVAQSAPD
jgi:Caspase domain